VQLLCHRTANRDLPENTLDALALAARMGCNIIEVDVTRTLDGELVLNHDNFLDRFTNSTGEVEHTELRELDKMDFGAWRGSRFRGMHIAHLSDALRLARELNVGLYLDIKTKGIGPQLVASLAREGMTERVIFGGEWDDIRALDPRANEDETKSLDPGFTSEQVDRLHTEGKTVIGSFSANAHEMDLSAMRAAVAAGADGIMVDYPRLGAEAVGRPVEARLGRLVKLAEQGSSGQRVSAIRELSAYIGFPLQRQFLRLLLDPDEAVSHEAALALVNGRPSAKVVDLQPALHSSAAAARRNAAWAIGTIAAESSDATDCVAVLLPTLDDPDGSVVKSGLLALTWCPISNQTPVPAETLMSFFASPVPIMRGLAAIALAKFQPKTAAIVIPQELEKEEADAAAYDAAWAARGRAKLSQPEIDRIIERYRAQMKLVQAAAMLQSGPARDILLKEAFRSVHDYSSVIALVAGYQLWDRLEDDPTLAISALASTDGDVADRAEWTLAQAGAKVLPAVRIALGASSGNERQRLIRVVAWQADEEALPLLRQIESTDPSNSQLAQWAIGKISSL
jgi:glycerophosphoryl diester phosphodiesterase